MFATILDYILVFLIAAVVALALFKAAQLYFGSTLFKRAEPKEIAANVDYSVAERKSVVEEEIERLEGFMVALATIAAVAPFIGLMGTVIHIMEALSKLGGASLDISLISGPIATALNSTLLGLASAIPAAIVYNVLSRRIQVMDNAARRILNQEPDDYDNTSK